MSKGCPAIHSTPGISRKRTAWRCVTTQNSLESNRLHNIRLQEDSTRFVMKQFRNIFFCIRDNTAGNTWSGSIWSSCLESGWAKLWDLRSGLWKQRVTYTWPETRHKISWCSWTTGKCIGVQGLSKPFVSPQRSSSTTPKKTEPYLQQWNRWRYSWHLPIILRFPTVLPVWRVLYAEDPLESWTVTEALQASRQPSAMRCLQKPHGRMVRVKIQIVIPWIDYCDALMQ